MMSSLAGQHIVLRIVNAMVFASFLSVIVTAEQLPIKTYTTADGLAHNAVNRIVADSRGFLWFCTQEGLSRFDGYGFTNYGIDEGLPSGLVSDLLETREGEYWVATADGLCRFNPRGRSQERAKDSYGRRGGVVAMFTAYTSGNDPRSRYILTLMQDRAGVIWCGTRNGLYRADDVGDEVVLTPVDLGIPDQFEARYIECLIEDRLGRLWAGARSGLYRRWPDGRVERYTIRDGLPDNVIHSMLEDKDSRIWVGAGSGLCRLVSEPAAGRNVVARGYTKKDGLQGTWLPQLFQGRDGVLWAGSASGLIRFIPTTDGRDFRFRAYTQSQGLRKDFVSSLAEDRNGNLWLGTGDNGVAKIGRSGFTTFGKEDGIALPTAIVETKAGELIVLGGFDNGLERFINQFNGESFVHIRPRLTEEVSKNGYGWGWNQVVVEDHLGEWWLATFGGLCRFPRISSPQQLAHTALKAIYRARDGLATELVLRVFEDSRGDIWVGSVGHGTRLNGLSRWERRTNTFQRYGERDNLPRLDTFFVSSFAEDRAGDLWIGFSGEGGLVRYRNGRFTLFTTNDGVPPGQIRNLFIDSSGRLWAASFRSGLIRIDDPFAESPKFVTYTTADGLSSNEIAALCEDQWGRIYAGTGRGIDRLDLITGRVKHYTTADGLPLGVMHSTLRDRNGTLWFSFQSGLARLVPEPDSPPMPPPIVITGLRIAGQTHQISALGETEAAPVELGQSNDQLQIDFVALGFSPGEGLRYQYKLQGASDDWSQLAEHRTVNFANLAPGSYRFLVRAVNADGVMSETPAAFSFTILPAVWQRWWFLVLTAMLVGVVVYAFYRYRLQRLLELERVRTRIATDLHDDIGSSLSQIAIMSEVVQQQVEGQNPRVSRPLAVIAGTSRELVDSMADIVWAINPQRDHLLDLTQRMRQFAADLLTARNISFRFVAPGPESDHHIETDVRREVFLIFKEAVNNAVRHSSCSSIEIKFAVVQNWLTLTVVDDGKGLDPKDSAGHGLASMRRRAQSIGGALSIFAEPGKGTTVSLEAPFRRRGIRGVKIST